MLMPRHAGLRLPPPLRRRCRHYFQIFIAIFDYELFLFGYMTHLRRSYELAIITEEQMLPRRHERHYEILKTYFRHYLFSRREMPCRDVIFTTLHISLIYYATRTATPRFAIDTPPEMMSRGLLDFPWMPSFFVSDIYRQPTLMRELFAAIFFFPLSPRWMMGMMPHDAATLNRRMPPPSFLLLPFHYELSLKKHDILNFRHAEMMSPYYITPE